MNLRKFWPTLAQDTDDDGQDDGTTMQILTDGTAQALCQRIWKAYITNDMTNFPDFMQQVDQLASSFQQSLPVPVNPNDLEDRDLPTGEFDLPSIGNPDDTEDD